ncbi:MAG: phosphomannomutase/phosphoglucomutase [Patescibacteria group bacterium]|nr:phosphomannomutase/phosphoglucomutase [Patescibacteria group bacterium]
MDPTIFKAYDVRGICPEQIDETVVFKVASALAVFLKDYYNIEKPKIVVGHDMRESSKIFNNSAREALKNQGCEVIDIGLCSTPLNGFANSHLEADGSIMITASHNPKEYNGLKLFLRGGLEIPEINAMDDIRKIASGDFKSFTNGEIKEIDLSDEYINFIAEQVKDVDFSKFRIAVDCGNGMAGPFFKKLAEKLKLRYSGLFMDPNGDFPNHPPDPLNKESLVAIKELMGKEEFSLGVLFDGDADRLQIIDNNGEILDMGSLIGIFAKEFLSKHKTIPCDARISRGVVEEIERLGGNILKTKVGRPNLKKAMRKEEAFFGGELSGHLFWQDFFYSESALLALIKLLGILEKNTFEELKKPFGKYFFPGQINLEGIEDKEGKIKEIEKNYSDGEVSHLDGLTVEYSDWWFNLRPSNTEPLLRLTIEANTKELLDEKIKELKSLI